MEEYKTLTEESLKEAIEKFIKENWQSQLKTYKWKEDGEDCEAYMFNLPGVYMATGKGGYLGILEEIKKRENYLDGNKP